MYKLPELAEGEAEGVIRELSQRKHFFLQEIFPYKIVQVVIIFFKGHDYYIVGVLSTDDLMVAMSQVD